MIHFSEWLEAVKREPITSTKPLEIQSIDQEDDWELAQEVENISRKVRIRFSREKNITLVAKVGDQVIGGVASTIYHEEGMSVYDFDVVVDPQWQGYQMVGFKLIDSAISEARNYEAHLIKVHVVNPRLAQVLSNKYDFEGLPNNYSGKESVILYKYL